MALLALQQQMWGICLYQQFADDLQSAPEKSKWAKIVLNMGNDCLSSPLQ